MDVICSVLAIIIRSLSIRAGTVLRLVGVKAASSSAKPTGNKSRSSGRAPR
jgi:hypothetical protein